MKHLKDEIKSFPINLNKQVIIGIIIFIVVICIIICIVHNSKKETMPVSQKNIYSKKISDIPDDIVEEEEIVEDDIEIIEEMEEINDNEDLENEEELEQQEKEQEPKPEKVVKYKDKEVTIPKSTVASVNSSEDAEKNKKEGGTTVSQEQANEMFQNEGKHSKGIDVSAHQGKINWGAVKDSGVDFAIIRVGFRGQTAGKIYEDKYFKTNVNGATSKGIKVGIYFYSTAINETEALEEAAWVVSKIAPYRITYPVVYDFEDFGAYRCESVNGSQATKNAQIYLNYVKSAGYEPMMYANKSDITSRMSRGSFSCKFWLAHYTTQTDYKGSVNMWQYTSKGSVPGISGPVDMNVAYFSYGTTAAPKHTHNYSELVKGSEKKATCTEAGSKTMRCSCGDTKTEVSSKLEHSWGEWTIVTSPTVTSEGTKKRTCSLCKKEETQKIDKLVNNENINNSIVNNNTVNNSTNTVNINNNVNNNITNNTDIDNSNNSNDNDNDNGNNVDSDNSGNTSNTSGDVNNGDTSSETPIIDSNNTSDGNITSAPSTSTDVNTDKNDTPVSIDTNTESEETNNSSASNKDDSNSSDGDNTVNYSAI